MKSRRSRLGPNPIAGKRLEMWPDPELSTKRAYCTSTAGAAIIDGPAERRESESAHTANSN